MNGESPIGLCPRCGRDLVRGTTPMGKVCFRCPSCAGVAVTLPALRESLDARSIAALTNAARAAEHAGCTCPGCGGRMSLMKVGDGNDKIEIDVCGSCLSVWCDKGEYETLAPPPPPKTGVKTMRELLARTSPEVRERYAATLLDKLPEDVSPGDFTVGDILRDIVRLVIGAPTLWRNVRPELPLFAILILLSLPIAQASIFYSSRDVGGYTVRCYSGYRDFWHISANMAEKFGFNISTPLNVFSSPFVQTSGRLALIFAMLLFMPLAVIERRAGHARFVGLFLLFMVASALAQALLVATGLAAGRLCGIAPVAIGLLAYSSFAWPDMRTKGNLVYMSVYTAIVGLFLLLFQLIGVMVNDFLSCGVGPIVACFFLGAILGRRAVRRAYPFDITQRNR